MLITKHVSLCQLIECYVGLMFSSVNKPLVDFNLAQFTYGLGYLLQLPRLSNKTNKHINGQIPLCSKMILRPNLLIENEVETEAANDPRNRMNFINFNEAVGTGIFKHLEGVFAANTYI